MHASCCVGSTIYVFCGLTKGNKLLSTVEKLSREGESWDELLIKGLTPRYDFAASAIGDVIVLLGGQVASDDGGGVVKGVYVFRTDDETLSRRTFDNHR